MELVKRLTEGVLYPYYSSSATIYNVLMNYRKRGKR